MLHNSTAFSERTPLDVNSAYVSYGFESAIKDVRAGQELSQVVNRLLCELTKTECLSLLDGDLPFWDGLRTILCDRYNRTPFVFGAVDRLGIPGIRFTDGPRGVVMGSSTAFPVAMARGATWDTALERSIGQAIGLEGKEQGANFFAGICVNLPRHPAWGRIQETYGEDPLLLGSFGLALTQGVRGHLMACVKHFAANSMENARFKVNVEIDEDVLHEVYLPHFRMIIEGGAEAVMASYNSLNGEWAGQSSLLLTKILRETWGFDGFVITDFIFGMRDPVLSLENGLDIEAPFMQQRHEALRASLDAQQVQWSTVMEACTRILRKQLQHYAAQAEIPAQLGSIYCDAHRDLARTAAARSMVLLKNHDVDGTSILPLSVVKVSKLAVIGRLANSSNTGDRGSSAVFSPTVVTPYEGLRDACPQIEVSLEDSDTVEEAVEIAKTADTVVCIVGYNHADEGEYVVPSLQQDLALLDTLPPVRTDSDREMYALLTGQNAVDQSDLDDSALQVGAGGDRKSLRLRSRDVEIIHAVTSVNRRVIVVVVAAGAVIMEEWREKPAAIMIGWYSGCEGGHALTDVLLGKVDASGRLPFSIPRDESHLPLFDIDATQIRYDRWHGQNLLDRLGVPAAFPLGFGLSYTKFSLSNVLIRLSPNTQTIELTLRVQNSGSRHGRCHVQIYGCPNLVDFPARVLMGFGYIDIDSGAEANLTIEISTQPVQRWRGGKYVDFTGQIQFEVAQFAGDKEALKLYHTFG